ncbi:hypothetical protein [Flavobacterium sp. DSP2-3-1]
MNKKVPDVNKRNKTSLEQGIFPSKKTVPKFEVKFEIKIKKTKALQSL